MSRFNVTIYYTVCNSTMVEAETAKEAYLKAQDELGPDGGDDLGEDGYRIEKIAGSYNGHDEDYQIVEEWRDDENPYDEEEE